MFLTENILMLRMMALYHMLSCKPLRLQFDAHLREAYLQIDMYKVGPKHLICEERQQAAFVNFDYNETETKLPHQMFTKVLSPSHSDRILVILTALGSKLAFPQRSF